MVKYLHLFGIIIILGIHTTSTAQLRLSEIKGVVMLEENLPAAAAVVRLKSTTRVAVANEKGEYSFSNVPLGNYQLEFSMIGYQPVNQPIEVKYKIHTIPTLTLKTQQNQLNEVVVTGQYEPQSLRKSVYQVRIINSERIQQRGATNILGVLNNELGFRFSNDMVLGTTDVQLMGMSGRNVKILLDGIPLTDRGDTRESLSQIDINNIERIEIVEGPMSVSYGSDALAGVINVITKKSETQRIWINARAQEETVNQSYRLLRNEGLHNHSIAAGWQKKGWGISAAVTNNDFGGWQGTSTERSKDWLPKDQLLGNIKIGYTGKKWNIWYRLDALNETILNEGNINTNTQQARDQKFITQRYMHQLQGDWRISERLQINSQFSYTDYQRRTQTSIIDFRTGKRTLSLGQGEQDISTFDTKTLRLTAQYKLSSVVSLQPGIDATLDATAGPRILGTPTINDFAFFISSSITPTPKISIRPGLRFIKNSVYDAPPAIPSLNTKFTLSDRIDLRFAYARGFRSPALRELYFNFFDASHSIKGNPNLKAEYSNSFNGSVAWQSKTKNNGQFKSTLGFFYNEFRNLINYGVDPNEPTVSMTINIDKFKTTGLTFENTFVRSRLQATLGFSYIGRYNSLVEDDASLATFLWSPEVNSNITYDIPKINTKVNLFYKYTGKRPSYTSTLSSSGTPNVKLAEVADFHWADFTLSKPITKYLTLNGGVKNILNVTRLTNTATDSGSAHGGGSFVPMSYGRSYFLGLNARWSH